MAGENRRYKLQFRTAEEKDQVIEFATKSRPVKFDSFNSYVIFLIRQDQATHIMEAKAVGAVSQQTEAGHGR
jgi:hypothetical protein